MTEHKTRSTLGSMMVLVLVAGTAAAAIRLGYDARKYGQLVAYHDRKRAEAEGLKRVGWDGYNWVLRPAFRPNMHRAAYHTKMAQKYAEAARHPWLTVAPDPPEPE